MNDAYKQIALYSFFQNGNEPNSGKAKLLYMACYDLDAFRRFIFETRFFDIYDVKEEVIERIKNNEEELLSSFPATLCRS